MSAHYVPTTADEIIRQHADEVRRAVSPPADAGETRTTEVRVFTADEIVNGPEDFPYTLEGEMKEFRVAAAKALALAQRFHEAYERLAPSFGYATREASATPWAEVPENNRKLMTAVCAEILFALPSPAAAPPCTCPDWQSFGACAHVSPAAPSASPATGAGTTTCAYCHRHESEVVGGQSRMSDGRWCCNYPCVEASVYLDVAAPRPASAPAGEETATITVSREQFHLLQQASGMDDEAAWLTVVGPVLRHARLVVAASPSAQPDAAAREPEMRLCGRCRHEHRYYARDGGVVADCSIVVCACTSAEFTPAAPPSVNDSGYWHLVALELSSHLHGDVWLASLRAAREKLPAAAPSLEGLDALAEAIRRNLYESADDRGGYAAAHDALAALLARVAQQDRDIEKLRSLWGEATAERKEAGRIVGEWIEAVLAHYPRTMAFDSTAPRLMVDNVLRRLRERADRAAHALGQYGTHRSECDYYLSAARHSCNCGFAAARAASPTTTEPGV